MLASLLYLPGGSSSENDLGGLWSSSGRRGHFDLARDRPRDRDHRLLGAARRRLHALLAEPGSALHRLGVGYFLGATWVLALGCLVLDREVTDPVAAARRDRGRRRAAALALLAVTVDETDEAFANIYSTAVSVQNLLPGVPQRLGIVLVSAAATAAR